MNANTRLCLLLSLFLPHAYATAQEQLCVPGSPELLNEMAHAPPVEKAQTFLRRRHPCKVWVGHTFKSGFNGQLSMNPQVVCVFYATRNGGTVNAQNGCVAALYDMATNHYREFSSAPSEAPGKPCDETVSIELLTQRRDPFSSVIERLKQACRRSIDEVVVGGTSPALAKKVRALLGLSDGTAQVQQSP